MYSSASLARRITLLLLTTSTVHASDLSKRHIQLVTPAPYEWDEYGPTNPLNPDGSDYPCKIPQGNAFTINGTATEMAIGETQTVSFSGWAVHGGGSCQFALTEGHAPTQDSAWSVIHSIEGGCPKANVSGNLEPGQDPDTYTFSIPEDFAPGDYTWAWTWVNKIASTPEFYMNCAPITVTAGSSSSKKRRESVEQRRERMAKKATTPTTYPDLFLANLGSVSSNCDTSEALYSQIPIQFPNPGNSVSRPNGDAELWPQACDGNPRNSGASVAATSSSSAVVVTTPVPDSATIVSSYATTSSAAVQTSAPVVESSASPATTTTAVTVEPSSPSTTVASAPAATSTGTSSSGSGLNDPCTDGYLLCVNGDQFSTCTGGVWDAPQNLGVNVTCAEEGPSVGLDTTYHWD